MTDRLQLCWSCKKRGFWYEVNKICCISIGGVQWFTTYPEIHMQHIFIYENLLYIRLSVSFLEAVAAKDVAKATVIAAAKAVKQRR